MVAIGGKTKVRKPQQPQVVVQRSEGVNEFLKLGEEIAWVGDPNAATKFDSKYAAKSRVRDMEDVPMSRRFMQIEGVQALHLKNPSILQDTEDVLKKLNKLMKKLVDERKSTVYKADIRWLANRVEKAKRLVEDAYNFMENENGS